MDNKSRYLHKVADFDPETKMVPMRGPDGAIILDENGNMKMHLPLPVSLTWFRLVYPEGKTTSELVSNTEKSVIFAARVFANYNDPLELPLSIAYAEQEVMADRKYNALESASSLALKRALDNAGFGCDLFDYSTKPYLSNQPSAGIPIIPAEQPSNDKKPLSSAQDALKKIDDTAPQLPAKAVDPATIVTGADILAGFYSEPPTDSTDQSVPSLERPPVEDCKETATTTVPRTREEALAAVFECNQKMRGNLTALSGKTINEIIFDMGRERALMKALNSPDKITSQTLAALQILYPNLPTPTM